MAEIGDRIGPFELVERLAAGRLTSLYRGVRADGSSRPPREVTLRVAAGGPDGPEAEAFDAVRAEYEVLRLLQDERIPQALSLYAGHGAAASAWVDGASLRDTLRLVDAGRLDLDAATSLDILVELAYALRHAHAIPREEGRIVHGALAAEVVRLTPEGKVILVGCGDPEPVHPRPLAPEQQQGVQEPRTDQWLLGALGIELLRHAPEVLREARGASIEATYGLLQAQWPAATRVLARMLAEAPADRYESEERLIKDLLALSRHLGGVSRRAEVGARTAQLVATSAEPAAPVASAPAASARPASAPPIQAGVPPVRPGAAPIPAPVRSLPSLAAPPPRPASAADVPVRPRPVGAPVRSLPSAAIPVRPPPLPSTAIPFAIEPGEPPRHVDAPAPRLARAAVVARGPVDPVEEAPAGEGAAAAPRPAAVVPVVAPGLAAVVAAAVPGAAAASVGPGVAVGPSAPGRLHPSATPRVALSAAPPLLERDDADGLEEVVAYTEETPAPLRPRAPAADVVATAAALRADAEVTVLEHAAFFDDARFGAGDAENEATEVYVPRAGDGIAGVAADSEDDAVDELDAVDDIVGDGPAAEGSDAGANLAISDGAPSDDDDGAVPFRPAGPPVEDPIPDVAVYGAMLVFGLVAAFALLWRFGG